MTIFQDQCPRHRERITADRLERVLRSVANLTRADGDAFFRLVAELALETFFPADDLTAQRMREIAAKLA